MELALLVLLAQHDPTAPTPEAAIGWAERMSKGGVPVICLCVAIASVVLMLLVLRSRLAKEAELTDLERTYRKDLEARAKDEKADAERRLAEAKTEAKERAVELDKIRREQMAGDRENAEGLAHAVQMIEACGKTLERVDRRLDKPS